MNVNSVSNVSNSYNSNSLNKTNNSPSFGALRADAADVFIQKAKQGLSQKGQNAVLEQLIQLAERAKQSSILDIGTTKIDNAAKINLADTVYNKTYEVLPGSIEKICDSIDDEGYMVVSDMKNYVKDSEDVQHLINEAGFKIYEYAPFKLMTSFDNFMQYLTGLFNKTESEIADKIETEKTAQTLMEKLNSLTTK